MEREMETNPIQPNDSKPVAPIPKVSLLEKAPPAVFVSRLALREGNSKKPIYQIHKWWARRLGSIFRSILISAVTPATHNLRWTANPFYTKRDLTGMVVLDPFMGGGTSLVEATKLGANVIGVDIDPVACFVTAKELTPIKEKDLLKGFRAVQAVVKKKILKWYRTELEDGQTGTIVYAFWVDVIKCRSCKRDTPAHPHFQLSRYQKAKKQVVFCSICGDISTLPLSTKAFACRCGGITNIHNGPVQKGTFTCPYCQSRAPVISFTSHHRPPKQQLFALEVVSDGSKDRVFKKATSKDKALYENAKQAWQRAVSKKFVPRERIPRKNRTDLRPITYGYVRYRDLFNFRQRLALSILAEAIVKVKDPQVRGFLAAAFSDALASNNMFCFYAFDYQKLTPLFGLHAYQKVTRPVENNVWGTTLGRGSFLKCFQKLLRAKRYCRYPFEYRYDSSGKPQQVFTGEKIQPTIVADFPPTGELRVPYAVLLNRSAENLREITTSTVDLILSDPPYYDNIAYSELSDFYHVWLKRLRLKDYHGNGHRRTPMEKSLYVSPRKQKAQQERFEAGLLDVFKECHRVLKNNGLFAFTFHHRESKAWISLASALFEAGFTVTNVFPVRSEGSSQFHSAQGNLKWDAVFCCRRRTKLDPPKTDPEPPMIWQLAKKALTLWKEKIRRAGLTFSSFDQESFTFALGIFAMSRFNVPSETARAILGQKPKARHQTKQHPLRASL